MRFKWADGRGREPLPIDNHLPEILSALRENRVVVVEAETGAGKTTRIPQAILLDQPEVKVWMTQTRRPAVRWNGKRIAWEMGESPGGVIGWRLFGDSPVVSRRTRLMLVVDQSLVNRIRRERRLPAGVLIIDEAHERSVSTDLLLGLIKQYLSSSPQTRVLITSATIDTQKFSEYFGGAPVVSVPGRCFPVETRVEKLEYAEHHTSGAIRAACEVMESFAQGKLAIAKAGGGEGRQLVCRGSVLVLLPGKDDINQALTSLAQKAEELEIADRVEILPCHGQISGSEQDAVQKRVPDDTLRLVCATEIVRSSVTVPDTLGVIDSLQVKRLVTDAQGVAHLKKVAVSRVEADQGKGRAGRTQPGFYIPISYREEYERLERWPRPAILREPIASVVLQVAAVGLDVRTFPFIDRPDEEKINVAIERLQKIGALDAEERITERGRLLVRFPVDPERAQTLIMANELGVLAEAIIAAAVLENEGIFHRPKDRRIKVVVGESILRRILAARDRYGDTKPEEVDLSNLPEWVIPIKDGRYEVDCGVRGFPHREGARWVADLVWQEFAAGSGSDFVAAVRAYRAFKAEEYRLRDLARELRRKSGRNGNFGHRWQENQLRQWCFDHFLNHKRLRFVQRTVQQLKEEVLSSPLQLENGIVQEREFEHEALTKALASGLVDHVCRRASGYRRSSFEGPMGKGIQLSYSSACPPSSELILIGGIRKIPTRSRRGGTSFMLLADMAAPVEAEWLVEIMPQLCESKLREGTARFNAETGTIRGTEDDFYGNVLIGSRTVQVVGEAGVQALAWALAAEVTGHPAEEPNKAVCSEVYELGRREGVARSIQTPLREWYERQLIEAGMIATLEEARQLDLTLTDEIVSELIGFDYPEYRERILQERPDVWVINGTEYPLDYPYTKRATLRVPVAIARTLTSDQVPTWEGVEVKVYVADEGYTHLYAKASEVETLRNEIEACRLDLAWKAFKDDGVHGDYDGERVQVSYEQPLPALPKPEVWDAETGSLAYPAWRFYASQSGEDASTTWRLKWFREEEKAIEAQAEAETRKAKADTAEYERQHFDQLVAQAQALFREVSTLWEQVDVDKYQAYGLEYDEVRIGWYASVETSIPKGMAQAKELAGLEGYTAKPTQAIECLQSLKKRLTVALAAFAANRECKPEAKAALEEAQALLSQVESLYDEDLVVWSALSDIQDAVQDAKSAFKTCQYAEAVEKARTAAEKAQAVIAAAEGAKRAKAALKAALSQIGEADCPVCGQELRLHRDGDYHTCEYDHQTPLVAWANARSEKNRNVLIAKVGDQVLARVEAVKYSRSEYDLYLRVDQDVVVESGQELALEVTYQAPGKREAELSTQIAQLESQLNKIERERQAGDRVEGTFKEILHRGKPQLQFEGTFTGSVENRNAPDGSGNSYYENQPAKFVCKHNCRWLDEDPKAGERWICTTAFQIAISAGKPVIVVNPQVRVESEERIRAEIERLRSKLRRARQEAAEEKLAPSAVDEDGEPLTSMAAAFAAALAEAEAAEESE